MTFKGGDQQFGSFFKDVPEKTNSKSNIAALDGVRAIAALAVLTFHLNILNGGPPWNMGKYPLISAVATFGGSGVTLFFILSGFLLFMPYARALLFEGDWPSTRDFYLRRALRIIPGYYAALFLIIVLFHPEYLHADHWQQVLLFVTFLMDTSKQTFMQLNGPFWTLAIEWQFYMLLPFIALGFSLIVRRLSSLPQRRLIILLTCCLAVIAWGLFIRYVGIHYKAYPTATVLVPRSVLNITLLFVYGMGGKYLESFAVGMIICTCYVFARHPACGASLLAGLRRISPWLWGCGLLILLFTAGWHFNVLHWHGWPFAYLDPITPVFEWLNEMVIAIGYGACIVAILFDTGGLKFLFERRLLRWIGLISYGLYMWHLPLLDFFQSHILPVFPHMSPLITYVLTWLWVVVFIIPVAFCSYALIEEPWMRLRHKLRKQQKPHAEVSPAVQVPEKQEASESVQTSPL